jgi:uncharacterized protein YcbX
MIPETRPEVESLYGDLRGKSGPPVGQLRAITRYAVKSVGGEALISADVRIDGLQHDRRYAIVGADGFYLSHEDVPELSQLRAAVREEGLRVSFSDGRAYDLGDVLDQELSRLVRQPVRLCAVELSTTHGPDALPSLAEHLGLPDRSSTVDPSTASHVHVLSDAAVTSISRAHPGETPRFRSTFSITLHGPSSGIPENGWLYRELTIGDVVMTVYGPPVCCCAAHSGSADPRTNTYGVHALVRTPGRARIGDPVYVNDATGRRT